MVQKKNSDLFTPHAVGHLDLSDVFIPDGNNDPELGYAWDLSSEPGSRSANKIVHYIEGYGWLGHKNCLLEVIAADETELFGLNLPGNVGRKRRVTYQNLRLLAPELFVKMFLAPHFNRELRKRMRRMKPKRDI